MDAGTRVTRLKVRLDLFADVRMNALPGVGFEIWYEYMYKVGVITILIT